METQPENILAASPEQRAAISRHNGARSRGPVTPEGKRRVGRNGLLSRTVKSSAATLAGEDPADRQFQSAIRTLLLLRKMRMQTQPKLEKSTS